MSTQIRHVEIDQCKGELISVAAFERTVSTWSLSRKELVGTVDTILDFGGRRLLPAMLGNQPLVCVANWAQGVRTYEANTGQELWSRRDLFGTQKLVIACYKHEPVLMTVRDSATLCVLKLADGRDIAELDICDGAYLDSEFKQLYLTKTNQIIAYESLSDRSLWRSALSKPILDVALGHEYIVISEMLGVLSCLESRSGRCVWKWRCEDASHCLRLSWNKTHSVWIAVVCPYRRSAASYLVVLSAAGVVLDKQSLLMRGPTDCSFTPSGDLLALSSGQVLRIPSLDEHFLVRVNR